MKKYVKNWEQIIRGEKFNEVKVTFYPCRNNMKGEYGISGKFVFEIFKNYKCVENWMKRNGYTPVLETEVR